MQAFYLVKDMLLSAPEITEPPNDPLTLEELREMDDADVWVAYRPTMGGFWLRMHALVEVCRETGDVFLTNNIGGRSDFYDVTRDGGTIYRRKPEEGHKIIDEVWGGR